jgi:phage gpG-like protein
MTKNVQVKDLGWNSIGEFFKNNSKGITASVGVQGNKAEAEKQTGKTNVEIATIHEFGAPAVHIPQRSFMRSTFDENVQDLQAKVDAAATKIYDGKKSGTLKGELMLIGEGLRRKIIEKLNSNIPPPLSDYTIMKKGGEATALIETGQMKNSISSTVVARETKNDNG